MYPKEVGCASPAGPMRWSRRSGSGRGYVGKHPNVGGADNRVGEGGQAAGSSAAARVQERPLALGASGGGATERARRPARRASAARAACDGAWAARRWRAGGAREVRRARTLRRRRRLGGAQVARARAGGARRRRAGAQVGGAQVGRAQVGRAQVERRAPALGRRLGGAQLARLRSVAFSADPSIFLSFSLARRAAGALGRGGGQRVRRQGGRGRSGSRAAACSWCMRRRGDGARGAQAARRWARGRRAGDAARRWRGARGARRWRRACGAQVALLSRDCGVSRYRPPDQPKQLLLFLSIEARGRRPRAIFLCADPGARGG